MGVWPVKACWPVRVSLRSLRLICYYPPRQRHAQNSLTIDGYSNVDTGSNGTLGCRAQFETIA
jgi:hypothetical protein